MKIDNVVQFPIDKKSTPLGMKHPLQEFAVNVVDESNIDADFAMPLADE